MRKYGDDGEEAEEEDDVVPEAHSHVLGGQLPSEDVHHLVFVLHRLYAVRDQDQQRRQWEALHYHSTTELIITRYPKFVTI